MPGFLVNMKIIVKFFAFFLMVASVEASQFRYLLFDGTNNHPGLLTPSAGNLHIDVSGSLSVTADGTFLPITGGTLTGPLTAGGDSLLLSSAGDSAQFKIQDLAFGDGSYWLFQDWVGDNGFYVYYYTGSTYRPAFNINTSGNISFAGNQTVAGSNNTMPNQTLTGATSIMTEGLADARYSPYTPDYLRIYPVLTPSNHGSSAAGSGGSIVPDSWSITTGTAGGSSTSYICINLNSDEICNSYSTSAILARSIPWSRKIIVDLYERGVLPATSSSSVLRMSLGGLAGSPLAPSNPSAGIEIRFNGSNTATVYGFSNTGSMVYSSALFTLSSIDYPNAQHIKLIFNAGVYSVVFAGATYSTGLSTPNSDSAGDDVLCFFGVSKDTTNVGTQIISPRSITVY